MVQPDADVLTSREELPPQFISRIGKLPGQRIRQPDRHQTVCQILLMHACMVADSIGKNVVHGIQPDQSRTRRTLGSLNFNDAFGLPNMVPQVSHGMTHWVKLDDGSNSHEACAYHVDNFDGMQLFCDVEKDPAVRWSNAISHILATRQRRLLDLRPSDWDENESVIWDLPAPENLDTSSAFNW